MLEELHAHHQEHSDEQKEKIEKEREILNAAGIEKLGENIRNCVKPGDVVYVPGNTGQMKMIHEKLHDHVVTLQGPEVIFFQLLSADPTLAKADMEGRGTIVTPFPGPGMRNGDRNINNGGVRYLSSHLSKVPDMLRRPESKYCPDVAVIQVSEPGEDGLVSLGEGGVALPAIEGVLANHGQIVAVINKQFPKFGGDCRVNLDELKEKLRRPDGSEGVHVCTVDVPLAVHPQAPAEQWELDVAKHITQILKSGDSIQFGIGNAPIAILDGIKKRNAEAKEENGKIKDLTVATEVIMVTPELISLVEDGTVTGSAFSEDHYGHVVAGIPLWGSQEAVAWLQNPENAKKFHIQPQDYCNGKQATDMIEWIKKSGHRVVSINAGLCARWDGTVSAHTIGEKIFSALGGANDFNRGADVSIVVIPSVREVRGNIISNITIHLPEETQTTYMREDTDYIATEYGIVRLKGLTDDERFLALLSIAHPDHRRALAEEALRDIPRLKKVATQFLAEYPTSA